MPWRFSRTFCVAALDSLGGMRYLVWVSLFEQVVAMRTFVLWQFSNVSICVSATFSSGTAEIRALDLKNLIRVEWSSENSYVLLILRCIYVRVQLSPQKQQKYKLSSEKNPIRERWSNENSYLLSTLDVFLRACATFSLETAEIRVLDWKTLSERDDPVRTAMFCRFWRCIYVRAQLSP